MDLSKGQLNIRELGERLFSFFWIISCKGMGLTTFPGTWWELWVNFQITTTTQQQTSCRTEVQKKRALTPPLGPTWNSQLAKPIHSRFSFARCQISVIYSQKGPYEYKVLLYRELWSSEVLRHLKIVVCTLLKLFLILKAEATYVQRCSTQQWPIRNKICVFFPFSLREVCQNSHNLNQGGKSALSSQRSAWFTYGTLKLFGNCH